MQSWTISRKWRPRKGHDFYQKDPVQEIMIHSHIMPSLLFLQTHYIRNIVVVLKVSCFFKFFISSGKQHPLRSSFQENDPYIYIYGLTGIYIYTSQPIQFTSIKYRFFIILRGYGHIGKWTQENIIFMRFCYCFKLAKRLKNCWTSSWHMPSPNAHWLDLCNRLRNLIRSEIWSHTCIFSKTLLLPSTATGAGWNSKCLCCKQKKEKKKKDPGLHKGNTGSQTLD